MCQPSKMDTKLSKTIGKFHLNHEVNHTTTSPPWTAVGTSSRAASGAASGAAIASGAAQQRGDRGQVLLEFHALIQVPRSHTDPVSALVSTNFRPLYFIITCII